ncbi:MAG: Holliday junction branch migration protein RuvA [Erysipelothrix sp.]|nr:Holliday junction branch migration protein RuvA [Erysipelothrix sp.]
MIAYLKGRVVSIESTMITLETNNIGYRIHFSQQHKLAINDQVVIHTFLNVREDEISLFGFLSLDDLDLFRRLISVKGVGPKIALNMFLQSDSERIVSAIEAEEVNYLKSLPGIGAKTASQIVLDLKGKLVLSTTTKERYSEALQEALSGLKNLGYKQSEINTIEKQLAAKASGQSAEQLVRLGLQLIMKQKGGH